MLPHPLTNSEIQIYYQKELRFNGVYSRNNLPKIKCGTYVINLHECKSRTTLWITLYVNGNNATYSDSFQVKYIPKNKKSWEIFAKEYHKNYWIQVFS